MIRRNLLSRDDAIHIVSQHDGAFPSQYLDKSLDKILNEYDISMNDFLQVCDDYTNYDLFRKHQNGQLLRRSDGSPCLEASFYNFEKH